jgi:hypothetical protein
LSKKTPQKHRKLHFFSLFFAFFCFFFSAENAAIFSIFSVDSAKKRKKTLAERLFSAEKNAVASCAISFFLARKRAKIGKNGPKMTENGEKWTENGEKWTENGPKMTENGKKWTENGENGENIAEFVSECLKIARKIGFCEKLCV